MKKTITFLLLLAFIIMPAKAADVENVKPVKNVILLIPDGTSLATVSMARWLQWYTNPDKPNLNLDPVSVRYRTYTLIKCSDRRLCPDYFLLHDRLSEPYRLCLYLSGK